MVLLTREQLEERLAALHRASLELVSDVSLETLLERIVNLAREQVQARYAALGVLNDQGELIRFIPIGISEEELAQMGPPPSGKGLIGVIQNERRTIRLADIQSDPRSVGFPERHPVMRSFLGVPILAGERLLGQIYLTDKEDFLEFTPDDERVIETLAAYAAVAIDHARMFVALQQRNDDLALVNDLAAALTCSQDLDDILHLTLDRVLDYLHVEAGEIFVTDEDNHQLRLALHRGRSVGAFWKCDLFSLGEGLIGETAQSCKPLPNAALKPETRFLHPAVIAAGFHYLTCIPMTALGKVMGVMSVITRPGRELEERETQLLQAIGAWAGTAIENLRLDQQARRLVVLEERERIGMDLHDGIIQSIYAVGLGLDLARVAINDDPVQARARIDQAIEGLNSTIRDLRTYILDLRPRQFRGEDLMDGLRRLVEEFRNNGLQNVNLVGPENRLSELPISHATALFHITQEALANIAKHAHATQTNVHVWMAPGRVLVEISDNGSGFDLRKMSVTLGHGLSNMHTRAHKVGGDVEITSEPGEGTTVLAWVPLRRVHELSDQPKQPQN